MTSLIWEKVFLLRMPWNGHIYVICQYVKKNISKHTKKQLFKLIDTKDCILSKDIPLEWLQKIKTCDWGKIDIKELDHLYT